MKSILILMILALVSSLTLGQLVIPGGKQQIDVNDEQLLTALAIAQVEINNRLNSPNIHFISRVREASVQIVNGLLYEITFELGESSCMKTQVHKSFDGCYPLKHLQQCHAKILAQQWDLVYRLEDFYCDPVMVKRETLDGGIHEVDTEDGEVRKALLALEEQMSSQFQSEYVSQVGKVLEAKAQIVSGVKYSVTFKFGQTYRLKSKQYDEPHRRSEVIRKMETCQAEIWVRSWESSVQLQYQLLSFQCEKSPVGGEFYAGSFHAIDVGDKDMLTALHAHQDQISIRLELQAGDFGNVLKAEAQIVAGVKYALTFEFNHQLCQATIWVQSWANKNELESLSCKKN